MCVCVCVCVCVRVCVCVCVHTHVSALLQIGYILCVVEFCCYGISAKRSLLCGITGMKKLYSYMNEFLNPVIAWLSN